MKLKLNGTFSEHRGEETVTGLLEDLKISPERVAVEVNLEIVRKRDYSSHVLKEGDSVEIVNFVGGG